MGSPVLVVLLALALPMAGCGNPEPDRDGGAEPVVVFAAASLRDALGEMGPWLGRELETERGPELELEPRFNFAGSNVLARQIEATRAADVFVSADPAWVDHLEEAGRLVPGSRRTVLANRLVAVARRDSGVEIDEPRDLATAGYRHLSLGDPRAVPAGIYARRFLEAVEVPATDGGETTTLWQRVAGRVAPAADVRAALAQVEARRDVVGIVYATDARSSDRVEVLFEVPPELAPPVRYEAAAIAGGPAGETAALRFLEALESDRARQVFRRHGFETPGLDTTELDTPEPETPGLETPGLETSGLETSGLETPEAGGTPPPPPPPGASSRPGHPAPSPGRDAGGGALPVASASGAAHAAGAFPAPADAPGVLASSSVPAPGAAGSARPGPQVVPAAASPPAAGAP